MADRPSSERNEPERRRQPSRSRLARERPADGSDARARTKLRSNDRASQAAAATAEAPKRQRDPLLSAICHDLRAPLAAVTMGTNYVLQTTLRNDEGDRSVRILQAMLRSCSQMERLIRNFADLSEIEADAVTLRLGEHDAVEMLELAADAFRDDAHARDVTVTVQKPKRPIRLRCDRDRLMRSIEHVVENAVRFAPGGSAVTLSVDLRGESVAFSVVDHGPGLSPEVRENLYDRLWHAKRASRASAGFGLAIARGMLAAHGGSIDVESRPNESTTFTLSLPRGGPTGR